MNTPHNPLIATRGAGWEEFLGPLSGRRPRRNVTLHPFHKHRQSKLDIKYGPQRQAAGRRVFPR